MVTVQLFNVVKKTDSKTGKEKIRKERKMLHSIFASVEKAENYLDKHGFYKLSGYDEWFNEYRRVLASFSEETQVYAKIVDEADTWFIFDRK